MENIKINIDSEELDKGQFFEDYSTVLESIKDISTLNEYFVKLLGKSSIDISKNDIIKFFAQRDKSDSKSMKIRSLEKELKDKHLEIEHLNSQLKLDWEK